MTILIKNGLIIRDGDSQPFIGDVLTHERQIVAIGPGIEAPPNVHIIDATGLVVMPGAIDPHVHLHYPQGSNRIYTADDFRSGSVAAMLGGTTTILDFIEPQEGETLLTALQTRNNDAQGLSILDYSFHMSVIRTDNLTLSEIPQVVDEGITSFKIYTAYDGIRLTYNELPLALNAIGQARGLAIVHSEDHATIQDRVTKCREEGLVECKYHPECHPIEGEFASNQTVLQIATDIQRRGVPLRFHIVHVSTPQGAELLNTLRSQNLDVSGEVCTQHITLPVDLYTTAEDPSTFVMSPPLRPVEEENKLMVEVEKGIAIQMITSDHAPFTRDQRLGNRRTPNFILGPDGSIQPGPQADPWWNPDNGLPPFYAMPGGGSGIEFRAIVAHTLCVVQRGWNYTQFVNFVSTAAAKRFDLFPQKGTLSIGSDADIAIWDPEAMTRLTLSQTHSMTDQFPYEGFEVKGYPKIVIVGGQILKLECDGPCLSFEPRGRLLKRRPM
ncbi:putative Dihydropyrimidinase [Blattamonas nauphoetae]|uniref:dihydropyrimidinase n=1 Tax=Blattamonas nauphoetae TaxID=2049346 RepID=A0ABQ9YHJ4_9EUKA|nr:putative Dihydropyrimidinase [Blattamonas nauphoetae]